MTLTEITKNECVDIFLKTYACVLHYSGQPKKDGAERFFDMMGKYVYTENHAEFEELTDSHFNFKNGLSINTCGRRFYYYESDKGAKFVWSACGDSLSEKVLYMQLVWGGHGTRTRRIYAIDDKKMRNRLIALLKVNGVPFIKNRENSSSINVDADEKEANAIEMFIREGVII